MRIYSFAGRQQHYTRLLPIFKSLQEQEHEVRLLAVDNVYNLDPATEYLIPDGAPFIHLLDYLQDGARVSSVTQVMLESIYSKPRELFDYVPQNMVVYSVRELAEVVVGFETLLAKEPPDVMMVLHENNFWTKVIAYLCLSNGVPCVGFQEGLLRHRDQETYNKQASAAEYVQRLFVWSDDDKQAYLKAGIPEWKLKVVGIPHMDEWWKLKKDEEEWKNFRAYARSSLGYNLHRPLVTFALPILNRYEGNPTKAIQDIVDYCSETGVQICITLHPFENQQTQMTLENQLKGRAFVWKNRPAPLVIAASDLILCQHSTIALESLALDIPVLEVDLENYGILQSLSDEGVAIHIGPDELNKIGEALSGKVADQEKIKTWKSEHLGPVDSLATERVIQEIVQVST